jgi:hypothetical protein
MSARHVAWIFAIACIAIAAALLRHRAMTRTGGTSAARVPASSPQRTLDAARNSERSADTAAARFAAPARSETAGPSSSASASAAAPSSPAPPSAVFASPVATISDAAGPAPSPASRGGVAAAALERFGRDATEEVSRCTGPSNALVAPIPVQLVFHRVSSASADQQSFVAVRAIPLPTLSAGGAAVRVAPEAERCLGKSLIGHAVFLPRDSNPATEFQHLATLQLAAVPAK